MLPPRNGLYLIRNTLYFGGHDITLPIVVLGIYVLVGAVVVAGAAIRGQPVGGKQMTRSLQSLPFPPPDGPRGGGSGAGGR